MSAPPALQAAGLGRRYGTVAALADVDLHLAPGRMHALVGENGAGKSTLFAVLAGLVRPTTGVARVRGADCQGDPARAARLGVGLLRQHGSLLPALDLVANFALARPAGWRVDRARLHGEVAAALAGTGVAPTERVASLPPALRQRAELARMLWAGQDILLVDEPTALLGEADSATLFARLAQLAGAGRTVVFSTHRLDEVLDHADAVHVLRRGRLALSAPRAAVDREGLLAAMFGTGKPGGARRPVSGGGDAIPALELAGLQCAGWAGPVDLAIGAGEAVGLVGLAGNGQDELVATLAGQRPPEDGEVRVGGHARAGRTLHGWGLRVLPATLAAAPTMPVADNMVLPAHDRAPYVRAAGALTDWPAVRARGRQAMAWCGLPAWLAAMPFGVLSGGNQRKAMLARELDGGGVALVAHNPEAGLDHQAVGNLVAALHAACARGMGLLVLAEDMDFLHQVAHRVLVVDAGRLVATAGAQWRAQARRIMGGLEVQSSPTRQGMEQPPATPTGVGV